LHRIKKINVMKINTLLSLFVPKDVKFFPLLDETVSILVDASNMLHELFTTQDIKQRECICQSIKDKELDGDKVTAIIFTELNNTFITPIDREDIHDLADSMDDVIDSINRTSQKVLLFSPTNLPEYTANATELIQKGSLEMQKAVNALKDIKKNDYKLREHCKNIKMFEEEGDTLYENSMIKIFHDEQNMPVIELIKLKEIVQELEKGMNKINSAGKVLQTILIKYA
jgi:uncharacterized protein